MGYEVPTIWRHEFNAHSVYLSDSGNLKNSGIASIYLSIQTEILQASPTQLQKGFE